MDIFLWQNSSQHLVEHMVAWLLESASVRGIIEQNIILAQAANSIIDVIVLAIMCCCGSFELSLMRIASYTIAFKSSESSNQQPVTTIHHPLPTTLVFLGPRTD